MHHYAKVFVVLVSSLVCSLSPWVQAENQVITIEGTRIRGNQELPTVLYIVPWQAPKVHQLETPESSLASQRPIKKIERDSFKRLVSYHQAFEQQLNHDDKPE
mgnify:CR=1 FL=1